MKYNNKILITIVAITIAAATLGVALSYFLYANWYLIDVQTKELAFKVTDETTAGFDLNNTLLTFGKVPRGGGAERRTTLTVDTAANARIRIDPEDIAAWVVVHNATLRLEPKQPQNVTFNLVVPTDAPIGNYSGTVTVFYTRRMPWE